MTDFRPTLDQQLIERLAALVAPLLDHPWHLRADALAQRSWLAVPVEKGRHVEPESAQRIAAAIALQTSTACYALATEPTGTQPMAYQVPATDEGLLSFSHECAGLNFILVPTDLTFSLLFTSEDYNLFAGPSLFLERALGTTIASARSAFQRYANDSWWEGRLLALHRYYDV
jgi:hypothetical protein